ncbi:MAG: hypothetical protein ACYDIA_10330 [Candidatus Humimicrobiaceae bacterium]
MRDSFDTNIYKFFEDNTIFHKPPYIYSSLYLLIRDTKVCLGYHPNIKDELKMENHQGAEWPGLMTIFSGIDLLGKLLAGCDSNGGMSKRFKDFIEKYFNEGNNKNKKEPDIILALRNALDHSFNLYSKDYKFSLINNQSDSLISDKLANNTTYKQVNVYKLYKNFQVAYEKYYEDLLKPENVSLRENFNEMFINYGTVYMY